MPPRFEDGFMVLLRRSGAGRASRSRSSMRAPASRSSDEAPVVEVRDLVKRFGAFTAVDHVSFEVRRGEIFGLLGPNGAGKTTTFRMLCGLLPPSGGTLRVAGVDLRRARASARQRIGYVAQKFSLYGAAHGAREPRVLRRRLWPARRATTRAHRLGPAAVRSARARARAERRSCPAATSSGWRWRRPCCTSRRSCSSTSRPAAPIRWRGASSGGASPRWPSRA